ncbi:unnamed protein product [Linum tenue]|uniref:S-protein homolog n=1 Tax=Linum tenue TaxID=586396 RepID=A0AAV0J6Y8_9ROSI|nr:unnamed protein product [Linum tenue]
MAQPTVQLQHTVRVVNQLSSGVLAAHCRSKDDDMGIQRLDVGGVFKWSFWPNWPPRVFGYTFFWCDLSADGRGTLKFDAYDGENPDTSMTGRWEVRDDGVHTVSGSGGGYFRHHFRVPWRKP